MLMERDENQFPRKPVRCAKCPDIPVDTDVFMEIGIRQWSFFRLTTEYRDYDLIVRAGRIS